MKRVETLLQKLQQQINEKLPVDTLLLTVQMMQHELTHFQTTLPAVEYKAVTVSMPLQAIQNQLVNTKVNPVSKLIEEEKTIEILQVDEAEIEAELEEIKRNATLLQNIGFNNKPLVLYNSAEDEVPTLLHQQNPASFKAPIQQEVTVTAKEVNEWAGKENKSLNDILKESTTELSASLGDSPVKDLRKAIGINDRFLYINELFRGDEAMYERSIKTINSFTIWPEAEYWMRRELKTKLGWVDTNPIVKQLDQLVKRRFS